MYLFFEVMFIIKSIMISQIFVVNFYWFLWYGRRSCVVWIRFLNKLRFHFFSFKFNITIWKQCNKTGFLVTLKMFPIPDIQVCYKTYSKIINVRIQNVHCAVINTIEFHRFNLIFLFVNSIFIFYKYCYLSVLSYHFGNQDDSFLFLNRTAMAIHKGENV